MRSIDWPGPWPTGRTLDAGVRPLRQQEAVGPLRVSVVAWVAGRIGVEGSVFSTWPEEEATNDVTQPQGSARIRKVMHLMQAAPSTHPTDRSWKGELEGRRSDGSRVWCGDSKYMFFFKVYDVYACIPEEAKLIEGAVDLCQFVAWCFLLGPAVWEPSFGAFSSRPK